GVWNLAGRQIDTVPTNLMVTGATSFYIHAMQDFDRDGDTDVLYSEKRDGAHNSYVRLNCSDEYTLEIRFCDWEYRVPEAPSDRHSFDGVRDLNGDGLPDLLYRGHLLDGTPLPTYI